MKWRQNYLYFKLSSTVISDKHFSALKNDTHGDLDWVAHWADLGHAKI